MLQTSCTQNQHVDTHTRATKTANLELFLLRHTGEKRRSTYIHYFRRRRVGRENLLRACCRCAREASANADWALPLRTRAVFPYPAPGVFDTNNALVVKGYSAWETSVRALRL